MSVEINIAQVSIKTSDTNFDLITLHQFFKIPALKRHDMIKAQQVEFIDVKGEKIKLLDALKAITELIKKLREEGTYTQFVTN